LACCNQKLNEINIEWLEMKSLCIVMCSKGYPDKFQNNIELPNLKKIKLDNSNFLFHAGTSKKKGEIFAVGGRVLNFVSLSDNFLTARKNIIKNIDILNWNEGFYRKDIGHKVIKS